MYDTMRSMAAALLAAALALAGPATAGAAISDYEFVLLEETVEPGENVISVILVDWRSGEGVANAVIFAARIDMAADGMATMSRPVEIVPSPAPGIYHFRSDLTMPGLWRLSLAAKIQGEEDTLEGRLILRAAP